MRLLIINVILLLVTYNTYSNTYYVSSTGNDLNDGLTDTTAWQSISKVNSFEFSAGDTLAFEGGSTFPGHVINSSFSNATELNRITITSYGNGWATISSSYYEEGISIVNAGFITISRLFLKSIGNTPDSLYTIYYNGIGVWLDSGITMNADNIVIDSIDASGYGGFGIMMSCHSKTASYRHVRITNSLFHDNNMGGLQVSGYADDTVHLFSHSDVYIGYCKAYNNLGKVLYKDNWSGCGILLSGLENGLVEYCEAYNNGKDNGAPYAGPVGIFLGEARYVNIAHCISHHNLGGNGHRDGGGFDLDQGSYGCVIEYCESYENEGAGYGLYQAPTPNPWSNDTIRYNTSLNDGRNTQYYSSITFWGANSNYRVKNAQVYGNSITLNKPGYALNFLNSYLDSAMIYNNSFCIEPTASFLNYNYEFPVPRGAMIFNNNFPCTVQPQQPFILPVTFRGAFAPSPTTMWSAGWTNYDPQSFNYGAPDSIIQTNITSTLSLIGTKRYLLKGAIYVTNGAVLNIASGAQIRFDKSTPNSALIITKGSKIYANGSATRPIVFTSNQAAGQRAAGDWAGVFILGKAGYNGPSGAGNLKAFPVSENTEFGGGNAPFDDDSSGIFQYVRIEFAGSTLTPSSRNDGLTLLAVGRGTIVDHVQVSFSNNDGFKWIGGAVNCRYLVSYKNADDNWEVGFGYHGAVQYGLGLRDPLIFTDAISEIATGIESSNDSTGSSLTPFTSPVFCNFTDIGPLRGNNAAIVNSVFNPGVKFGENSRLRMLNSIVMDYPSGVQITGSSTVDAATGNFISSTPNSSPGNLIFRNNLIAGSNSNKVLDTDISWDMAKWFGQSRNDSLLTTDTILTLPYATGINNSYIGDYRPTTNSAALKNFSWNDSSFYSIDSTGKTTSIIPCPIIINAPATIIGNTNAYLFVQSGDTAKYYLAAKSNQGILQYNWTVPAGVNIESGQGTDTLIVRYTNTFISGNFSVKCLTYCGDLSSARTLTINKIAPKTYTFTGNGLWTDAVNWMNGSIPPSTLPFSDEIIIAHEEGEEKKSILNRAQTISRGAKLTIQPGKNLTIQGNLLQLKY